MVSLLVPPDQSSLMDSFSVVTILIVNSDNFAASAFDTVFQAAGVSSMSYSPESAFLTFDAWPTLGTLIDAGTRLVTFLDNAADFTAVPYLLDGRLHSFI